MKTRNLVQRILAMSALVIALAVVVTATFRAQAQRQDEMKAAAPSSGGAALGTGVFSLLPGQTVRVAAVNVGGKEIPLQLYIIPVSEQGKLGVPIRCDLFAAPGDAAFESFTHPGGANRMLMYVQVRVRDNPNDINELVPSVEVFNAEAGIPGPHFLLSGGDFASFRPIWVPT